MYTYFNYDEWEESYDVEFTLHLDDMLQFEVDYWEFTTDLSKHVEKPYDKYLDSDELQEAIASTIWDIIPDLDTPATYKVSGDLTLTASRKDSESGSGVIDSIYVYEVTQYVTDDSNRPLTITKVD